MSHILLLPLLFPSSSSLSLSQPDFFRETKAEPAHAVTPAFRKWKGRNKRWLKPEVIYRAENAEAGIKVTVIPFYMGSHKEGGGGSGSGR